MKSLIYYLLQVVITSGLLYGYYYFILRNKKFHHYNRFYLLASVFISMLIPFLQIPVYFSEDTPPPAVLQSLNLITFNSYTDTTTVLIPEPKTNWLTWQNLSWSFYILISILFLLKIIFSLNRIRSIIRNNTIEKLDHINFVNTNEPETPFSFFRWMFWNRNIELSSEKGEQVFRHELFHIQQRHSWDIVFIELVTIVFWINPFFHLIKKELKAIHEFLADEFAVKENQEWKYAEFLLMQALNTRYSLINPFFHNQIKRRIAMITTSKKSSYQYLRKIMVLPIAAIALALFAFSYKQIKQEKNLAGSEKSNVKPKDQVLQEEITIAPLVVPDTIPKILKKYNGALILVDGKEKTVDELNAIDPGNIQSITVLKDKASTEKYGEKGKNGVIILATKNPGVIHEEITIEDIADTVKPKSYFYFDDHAKTFTGFYQGKKIRQIQIDQSNEQVTITLATNEKIALTKEQALNLGFFYNDLKRPFVFNDKGYKILVVVNQDGKTIAVAYKDKPVSVLNLEKTNNEERKKWEQTYGPIPPPPPPPPSARSNELSNNKLDQVFTDVDVDASFPGGDGALKKFLELNLDPSVPVKKGAPKGAYTVWTQFIVDDEGNTRDWKPLTLLGFGMEQEALRVLKKVPKWVPAVQNGHNVTAYRKQPVTFLVGKDPYGIKISKSELEKTTPFSLLRLQPGEEVVSFKMIFDAVGIKPKEFDLTGNYFSDEVKTRIGTIQTETYIYLENIKVRSSNRIETKPPMYGTVVPEQLTTNAFNPNDPGSWNFDDPEFKKKWHEMISEIKAIAWKEGKAAYEYKGRTYVFGKIKNPDPTVAAFTEQNGTGHVFLLNGELITSINELNKLITRSDVKKFGFITQEEANKRFNRNEAIVFIETSKVLGAKN